jgi:hypothetical protein
MMYNNPHDNIIHNVIIQLPNSTSKMTKIKKSYCRNVLGIDPEEVNYAFSRFSPNLTS